MTIKLLTTDMGQPMIDPKTIEKIMPNKHNAENTNSTEEVKDQNLKYNLSKFEYDLYHEEDDVAEKVIRVKRSSMPNKGEKWKVMNDNKVIFTIESPKISKGEREYLQTVEGFNFILTQAKTGIKSLNSFRIELKKQISKTEETKTEPVKTQVVEKVPKKRGRKKLNKTAP